jgi:hypothetical protein
MSDLDPRTGLAVLRKQPDESRLYTFEFTGDLGSNTISTVVSVSQTNMARISGSTNLTLGSPTNNTTQVQVRISAGQDLEDYKMTAKITDSGGNTLELDGLLQVRAR